MATLRLMSEKKMMGFKIDTTPYTPETLAAADYDFSVYNVSVSPEIEMYGRKLARGDYSHDRAVAGKRKFSCSCSVDVHRGSAAGAPPQYFQLLRACCLKQLTSATGVWLITDSTQNRVPLTIEVVYPQEGASGDQLVFKGGGCMGNGKLVLDQVGMPMRVDFEFQGALISISDRPFASRIVPTAFDTALPPAVLSATINLYGTIQFLRTFTLDLGNDIQLFTDPSKSSGYQGARVTGRNPTLELDPDMLTRADIDLYSNQISNTTGAFSLEAGSNIYISAPVCQIEDAYKPADAEGHVTHGSLKLGLKRNLGDDELEIRQGTK